jgi:hypothetical protein
MPAIDELSAATAVYVAALRAKAREPLTVSKFVNLKRCRQDPSGATLNATELIAEVKAARPELFEQRLALKPPEPPKEDRTKDAFKMSAADFEREFARRYPLVK